MKQTLLIGIAAIFLASCGEEGIGFNAQKEFPLEIPVELPSGSLPISLPGDPGPVTREDEYSLSDVDAFSGDLDALEEVIVNGLSYEITEVDANEEFDLDNITIELTDPFGNRIALIDISTPTLTNISKTELSNTAGLAELEQALDQREDITSTVSFDFAEIPDQDVNFNFVLYFDVTAKIRDL
ncbi:hypothetical protein [Marinoscillum sp.]|uniref:hypothetical protein n=1 Tax=Marinoscillum sp. TaxID=2024838 RepID=UPI003BAD7391